MRDRCGSRACRRCSCGRLVLRVLQLVLLVDRTVLRRVEGVDEDVTTHRAELRELALLGPPLYPIGDRPTVGSGNFVLVPHVAEALRVVNRARIASPTVVQPNTPRDEASRKEVASEKIDRFLIPILENARHALLAIQWTVGRHSLADFRVHDA